MATVRASLFDGENCLHRNIPVWIEDVSSGPGRLKDYQGHFSLPGMQHQLISGSSYRLVANDGREGEVLISSINVGTGQDTAVSFQVNGPFE